MPINLNPLITVNSSFWDSVNNLEELVETILDETFSYFNTLDDKILHLDITLTDDAEMQEINSTYRDKNTPTNVLSFPQFNTFLEIEKKDEVMLGDVVLSYSVIDKEAKSLDITFEDHFSHLIVHGALHLLGFDHEREEDATSMEKLEAEILSKLGIIDPYLRD